MLLIRCFDDTIDYTVTRMWYENTKFWERRSSSRHCLESHFLMSVQTHFRFRRILVTCVAPDWPGPMWAWY